MKRGLNQRGGGLADIHTPTPHIHSQHFLLKLSNLLHNYPESKLLQNCYSLGWVYNESFPFLVADSQDSPQCFNQQKRAKEEQKKSPSTTVFVPSCNKDGTYKTVQCEKVSRYCWCVHSVTGRNIPNTSVQNAKPDCTKPCK